MFSCQFVLFVSVLAFASARPQLQNHYHHSAPVAHHAVPVHHNAAPVEHYHHDHHEEAPAHYKFAYKVNDPHTHDIKEQEEVREGHNVHGHYSLVEPDGTTRIVHYTADKHGFHAVVEHQGHAQHPEVHHQHKGAAAPVAHHHIAPIAHHSAPAVHHAAPGVLHHQQAAPVAQHFTPVHHQQAGSAGGAHHGATSHISFSSHGHGHEYHH